MLFTQICPTGVLFDVAVGLEDETVVSDKAAKVETPAVAKVLSPLKNVVLSLVPLAVSFAKVTVLSVGVIVPVI